MAIKLSSQLLACCFLLAACTPVAEPEVAGTAVTPKQLTLAAQPVNWWDERVFYEIWPRSFYDADGDGSGDFKGMQAKLPYLEALGVKGIWLTPIFEAPSYHGYDFQAFYEVESDYGTMADFDAFIAAAHERDMKVILDLVLNHISDGHDWFKKSAAQAQGYEDYFIWRNERPAHWGKAWSDQADPKAVWHWSETRQAYYYGAFGPSQPDVNLNNPKVVTALNELATFWLNKGVDGFRLDAVRYAVEEDSGDTVVQADSEGTIAYWRSFQKHVKSIKADALLVAEAWADMPTVGRYWDQGQGVDGAFDFDFGYAVTAVLNQKDDRSADFGNVSSESTPVSRETLWQNLVARQQHAPMSFYAPFLNNHDQERVMYRFDGNINKAKVAASLLLTTPGSAYLYYGEEVGVSQLKTGDDQYRRAIMPWENKPGGGFNDTQALWLDQKQWFPWDPNHSPWWGDYWDDVRRSGQWSVQEQRNNPESLWRHYQRLIAVRNQQPALYAPQTLNYFPLPQSQVWLLQSQRDDKTIWTLVNLGDSEESIAVPKALQGEKTELLSQQPLVLSQQLKIKPWQTLIIH